jgi:hypothetical protein
MMNHLPCLTLEKDPAQSVVVGSALMHGWDNGNARVVNLIAKLPGGRRHKPAGVRGTPITSLRAASRSVALRNDVRNRCVCRCR